MEIYPPDTKIKKQKKRKCPAVSSSTVHISIYLATVV
jgi:hypothetical protein